MCGQDSVVPTRRAWTSRKEKAPTALTIRSGRARVSGDLARGAPVSLAFATKSTVACFPKNHNAFFDGNHVFYTVTIPPQSVLTITAKPRGSSVDVSLYAYTGGGGKLPPHVSSVVSCEASYKTSSRSRPNNPGEAETVKLVATKNGYSAVIAVAGVNRGKTGKFDLELTMATAAAAPTGTVKRATSIGVSVGRTTKKLGRLDGAPIIDLAWAARSDVACFPNPQFKHFSGGHVVFKTKIPPKSVMNIRAIPKRRDLDISLYAWMGGGGKLPPALHQAITCEASYGTKSRSRPFNPGGTESVRLNAIKNGYDVYIAVAGAQGVTKGDFTIEIDLATAKAAPTGKVTAAKKVTIKAGKAKVSGKLDGAPVIDLAWAARSDVACFPNPQFRHFNGGHVVFETDIPPNSVMHITATPKNRNHDISLYAWMGGGDKLPPAVHQAITCEAAYGTSSRSKPFNPGKAEKVRLNAIKNGYKVHFAVAGAQGLTTGDFDIEIDLKTKAAGPTGKVTSAKTIVVNAGKTKVMGKLDGGPQIALEWAARSDVACFPNTASAMAHFDGAHVVYKTRIPPYSVMKITAKPQSSRDDISLYAWMGGGGKLPPALHQCITCEASYGTNSLSKPFNPGKAESVRLNAIKNGYDVYIAVAGVKKTMKAGFELEIDLQTKSAAPTGKVTQATAIDAKAGITTVNGQLEGGPQIALGWAARSDVACFPNTASAMAHFDGAHVVYKTRIPPYSVMNITATPKSSKDDISLYAWMGGGGRLPPALHQCITCEASYGTKSMSRPFNPGKAERVRLNAIKNGYDVYIGVAGVKKSMRGSFELKIDLKTKAAAPTGRVTSAKTIKAVSGKLFRASDRLDGGPQIALDWAARSEVACFPNHHFKHFSGAHKLYLTKIPPNSNMVIRVIPKDPKLDLSLYAWMGDVSKLPPATHRAITCESSYGSKSMSRPFSPGRTETVKLNSVRHGYNVAIGVSAAQKVTKGAYTIEVHITPK